MPLYLKSSRPRAAELLQLVSKLLLQSFVGYFFKLLKHLRTGEVVGSIFAMSSKLGEEKTECHVSQGYVSKNGCAWDSNPCPYVLRLDGEEFNLRAS